MKSALVIALLLVSNALVTISGTARATTLTNGPSPEIAPETAPDMVEIARLRIHNVAGGAIAGSRDGGEKWEFIGRVKQPTDKVNRRGYNASKYTPVRCVAATAVNAIHLKASNNTAENRGIIWSLAPAANTEAGRNSLQSEVSPGSTVYTDIPGGTGVFGGPFTPFVGNPIFLDNDMDNVLQPLPDNYVPKVGDVWVIRIERPRRYPQEIIFENRFGGLITIHYHNEEPRVIGQVLRPVLGIGRFVGSYFSEPGRLRANHNGVIDISTSPYGKVGSFQIVPANHAMSPETHYIRELTQWMVVGPVSALDPSWEGQAPLYSAFLRPRNDPADLWNENVLEGLAGRFRFQVRMRGKTEWQPMPTLWVDAKAPLPGWAGTALANVTHIRIWFPFTWTDRTVPVTIAASTPSTANTPPTASKPSVTSAPAIATQPTSDAPSILVPPAVATTAEFGESPNKENHEQAAAPVAN
jgi:hypothetical protein